MLLNTAQEVLVYYINMNIQEIKKRWLSNDGENTIKMVLRCLERGLALSSIKGLEMYCGRWDLRGAKLSSLEKEKRINIDSYSYSHKLGTLKVRNCNYASIDFSFADISYSSWEKVNIENCLFEGTKGKETRIVASKFKRCIFRNADLSGSYININAGTDSGTISQVEFINSNLSKCLFYFTQIENSRFEECKIKETDFDGSRFKNCVFKGKIESAWFKGYSENMRKSVFKVFNPGNLKQLKNKMENIDFSECEIQDVMFENGINLERCIFPKKGKYIIVRNLPLVYKRLKEIIKNEWDGELKRVSLFWIDNLYFSKKKQEMPIDIINKECTTDYFPTELYLTFFNTLETINREINSDQPKV